MKKTTQERVSAFLAKIKPRHTLNKALLRKIAARLKRLKHEEHYDQGTFCEVNDCGTSACIAGQTLIAAGLRPEWLKFVFGCDVIVPRILQSSGNRVAGAAQLLLGLTHTQRATLFDGGGCTWPEPYSTRYSASRRATLKGDEPSERPSRIAAKMLEAIASGEVTL